MSNEYENLLTQFGLKPQEAKVYLASLKLGQATVGRLAETADVQRTFVYDIVRDLSERGLMSQIEIRGKLHFSPVSLEQFQKIQENKLKKFAEILPELKALEKTTGDRPRVRFFEGKEGIRFALEDTLNQPNGGEILAYATAEGFYQQDEEYALDYIQRRVAKKIFAKTIAPDNSENRWYTAQDKQHLRQTRLVNQKSYPFTNEIDIYGNKVTIMSLQGELLAVIIESKSIASTQRAIFELAWRGAGAIDKKK